MTFRAVTLGDVCRRARINAGHTQSAAARQLNITQTHLSNVEHGRRGASPTLLRAMASLYGVEADSLWREEPIVRGDAA